MKKSCSSLVFLVFLTLFKGVEADLDHVDDIIYSVFITLIVLGVIVAVACLALLCWCGYQINKRQTDSRQLSQTSQHIHSSPSGQPQLLQIVNPQSISHPQAHGAVWLPNVRERSVRTANTPEVFIVELPPLHPGEEPPPPYPGEEPSPPNYREEPLPPYSREEHLPPEYSEEPLPPYSEEESLPPYTGATTF
ncbi:hypothetical protein ACROYT_G020059 [Oculina patagonica]